LSSRTHNRPLDFRVGGDGPGVVLIHGTGADAVSNWGLLIESLSRRYTVVAPNLPGAGETPARRTSLDVAALADEVVETVDRAGVAGPFDVVGHSLGAVVAAGVAVAAPDRVRSLLLHAGWVTSGPRERLMFELWGHLLATDTALLARALVLDAMSPGLLAGIGQPELDELVGGFESLLDDRIAGQIELDGRVDISGLLAGIRVPTLVLASAEDQVIPPRHQCALAEAIPSASYKEMAGGHGLPFEDPGAFFAEIERWLGEVREKSEVTV
jgi:pimeloyl-ACP methyl ester carboxylesterase